MPIPSNQLLPICVLSNLLETNKLRPIKDTWQEYDEYAIIIYNIYNHNDCFDHTLICLNELQELLNAAAEAAAEGISGFGSSIRPEPSFFPPIDMNDFFDQVHARHRDVRCHQATKSKNMPLSVHFGLMQIANLSGVSTEGWSAKGFWMLLALLTHVSRGLHFAFFGVKAWQACHCRTQNAKVLSLSSLHSHCRQDFWLVTMFQIVQHKIKSLECCL